MTVVLFATEYDTPNIVVNMLSETPTEHHLFPLMIKYKPSNRIEFVLQTQRCPDSTRVRPVFICDARRLSLSEYVSTNTPLPARVICAGIDADATRELYEHLFDRKKDETGHDEENGSAGGDLFSDLTSTLKCLVHYNRSAILRYLNNTFLSPTSPSWFLSTYGTHEGTLILTMSYYLFERQYSTIQTTRDYTKCFTADPGRNLFTYINMRDFMATMNGSRFRKQTARFAAFAKARNARDRRELEYVDAKINAFREESRLAADSCVYYVYLAYRTALCREKFLQYCEHTAYDKNLPDDQQCAAEENYLGRSLDAELISIMNTYFSVEGYFGSYIHVDRAKLSPPHSYRGYDWNTEADTMVGYSSTATNLAISLRKLNSTCESLFSPLPPTLMGLLKLCASDRYVPRAEKSRKRTSGGREKEDETRVCRRNYLLNDTSRPIGPMPVFRVEMPEKRHVFCAVSAENWTRRLLPKDLMKNLPSEYVSDECLTDAVWLREDIAASCEVGEQLYRTRHEMFNENLPVFNFVGDVDLKLREDLQGLSRQEVFDLCRALRRTLIGAWRHLFPEVDPDSHPVFFFKSACPQNAAGAADEAMLYGGGGYDEDDDPRPEHAAAVVDYGDAVRRPPFCVCRRKLGLRVIIPFPPRTAAIGAQTLKRLAGILDHTLCLDRDLVCKLNAISHPGECFDTGIYSHGRSIRMPLMYKLDEASGLMLHSRLNPIFIVPAGYRDRPAEFVLQQLCPQNLTHHGRPPRRDGSADQLTEVVLHITDRACADSDGNFLQSRARRAMSRRRLPLGPLLRAHLSLESGQSAPSLPTLVGRGGGGEGGASSDYEEERAVGSDEEEDDDDVENLQAFARRIAWPALLRHTRNHYREEVQQQLEAATVFTAVGRTCVAVKRGLYGRARDFSCLAREHYTRQETVQVFLDIRGDQRRNVWATLWSRCFTRRCNSNAKQTHLSLKISLPSQY
ncbi:hypothetical protein MuHV1_gp065 [Murid betaherpesvirus 1]|uniref:hypothetical protein n=1 Tax=Murid herpesvirus 1 TaxID=10366 RepID=UPI00004EBBFB|nr:hypothetical protein MuHV1_gp065 [Murid betaherpesvirus 1]AQQ81345.1 M70 protein [Murid betaherpesvirus 1]WEG71723.1 helicase-primase primase subunit [Murid betaherpesvirus 1]CAJ1013287.1 M70 protein [Murid betaherpesvirus 1]CAJ1013455.1 M70 protein [Murid betaherpesvirus 1]DBA07559.1 TPA_asm: M70 [Murid betaherpesvirus 1]